MNPMSKKKENNILMSNAQLGLWTNIMLHELKQYLPGVSLPLIKSLKILESSDAPKELCGMIKMMDENYRKISSLLSSFRERMDPTHTFSITRIEGSYFNNVESILPLSYLKAASSLGIHTKNNLPNNIVFFSDIFYIEHVLMNLIKNSVESIEEKQMKTKNFKGEINITIEYVEGSDEVQFSVRDNGSGLSDKINFDVIEPFHSSKEGKIRGLGMYICKTFVEMLGGNINHESQKEGCEFIFTIPARRKGELNERCKR